MASFAQPVTVTVSRCISVGPSGSADAPSTIVAALVTMSEALCDGAGASCNTVQRSRGAFGSCVDSSLAGGAEVLVVASDGAGGGGDEVRWGGKAALEVVGWGREGVGDVGMEVERGGGMGCWEIHRGVWGVWVSGLMGALGRGL